MEENKKLDLGKVQEVAEKSFFNFQKLLTTYLLNWKWFVLSLIICLGIAAIKLRYATPIYQSHAKLLVKAEDNSSGRSRGIQGMTNLGIMSNSAGLDNEIEILKSRTLAADAIRDLKLYATYTIEGRIKEINLYRNQPITVDLDSAHLERLNAPIRLVIERKDNKYVVTGTYYVSVDDEHSTGPYSIEKTFNSLPATIGTRAGIISLNSNGGSFSNGSEMKVTINSPKNMAGNYAGRLSVNNINKASTILNLGITDPISKRASDYLRQLVVCYNRQANDDKNMIALRTEEFINSRLEKISGELGTTEGALESYKRSQGMTTLGASAGMAAGNTDEFEKRLADASTQLALLDELSTIMNQSGNKYQLLPADVGLSDGATSSLINRYNEIALERNRMLRTSSESNPAVLPLTSQLDDLSNSIRRAMTQNRRNLEIQRNSLSSQYGKYAGRVSTTPEQERILNQIGRQQDVKSGLYLMLLQKREENSISLASTADKGRLIDPPLPGGKVSPNVATIMLVGGLLGLAIPALAFFLIQLLRYKIEGHEDVTERTKLPILADVPVASESAKTKADIVVHENKNNQMEEIFRSLRTNLQFMLHENEKVIMFTSTTSGEGKTFNAANLAVSFALLGKKVVLVGLDIRKPRLAELFEIKDHQHGITPLLTHEHPTAEMVRENILPSGVNNNLDLLMAGPIPPNPTELISRSSLDDIINILKEQYDYVLIDTAPVGLVSDTLQIGRVANATIYMCRADFTPKSAFDLINDLAAEKKLPNMAIVLNGIDMSKKKYGYYYGYKSYGKYAYYGKYGRYSSYGSYGTYSNSNYGDKHDTSIKR